MPELPEVETVRRGLAPVMEGARFVEVEARRGDLRWPLPKDFAARLEGATVTGLGRRAKYLLANLSSGEVLLMHLGMSGSFRVSQNLNKSARGEATPGAYYHDRSKDSVHDHVVFHMSSGAKISFNDLSQTRHPEDHDGLEQFCERPDGRRYRKLRYRTDLRSTRLLSLTSQPGCSSNPAILR
jgi:formamidopyrimidine-DNA glycosylase